MSYDKTMIPGEWFDYIDDQIDHNMHHQYDLGSARYWERKLTPCVHNRVVLWLVGFKLNAPKCTEEMHAGCVDEKNDLYDQLDALHSDIAYDLACYADEQISKRH